MHQIFSLDVVLFLVHRTTQSIACTVRCAVAVAGKIQSGMSKPFPYSFATIDFTPRLTGGESGEPSAEG